MKLSLYDNDALMALWCAGWSAWDAEHGYFVVAAIMLAAGLLSAARWLKTEVVETRMVYRVLPREDA